MGYDLKKLFEYGDIQEKPFTESTTLPGAAVPPSTLPNTPLPSIPKPSTDHPEYEDLEITTSGVDALATDTFTPTPTRDNLLNSPISMWDQGYTFTTEQRLEDILAPSNILTATKLDPYIQSLDLPLFNEETDMDEQSYTTLDGTKYTLKDDTQLNECYTLITDLQNYGSLSTFVKEHSPILKNDLIMKKIDALLNSPDFQNLKGNFLGRIQNVEGIKKTIKVILTKVVTDKIILNKNEMYNTPPNDVCEISLQDLSLSVGSGLANLYINERVFFNLSKNDTPNHAPHTEHYYNALYPKLKDIFNQYEANTYTIEKLQEDVLPHTFENNQEANSCFVLLQQSLLESKFGGNLYEPAKFKLYETLRKTTTAAFLQYG